MEGGGPVKGRGVVVGGGSGGRRESGEMMGSSGRRGSGEKMGSELIGGVVENGEWWKKG